MNNALVSYQLDDEIGLILVNNPPVNALSQAVRAGIVEALAQAQADTSKLVLLQCAGRTFIAGADITEFGKPAQAPGLPEVIELLENFSKPIVAALHGTALGGGLEVAMAAHYRCALASARLGLPEVKLGLLPGAGGTQRLPRLVGVQAALDMMISGTPITAAQGLELGLVDQVVEDLPEGALAYARELIGTQAPPRPTGKRPAATAPQETFFADYRAGIARKSRGLIAPGFIVDLVEASCSLPLAQGQAQERERFIECRNSPQSAALRHVFFAERASGKIADIAPATAVLPVQSVAVIGAGTMGGGIAMNFINAGIPVTLVETNPEALERGLAVIQRNYATSVQRGRFSAAQVQQFMALLSGTTDYAEIADVDLVIEAVFENMAVKKQVFARLDEVCKAGCMLATNTSYLDVNDIAASTGRPALVLGAHFFSPANVMKLLEVVRAEHTAPEVVHTFMKLARTIGKIPVPVKVCHGFVGNRMLRPYARQAQLLLLEGASPAQVDAAMESWGMAMGPIAVGDLAGLDIGYSSRRDQGITSCATAEIALADTLVERGRLGQKSGSGYYHYDPATRRREADPEVAALLEELAHTWGITRREIADAEIVERLLLALVNEGAAILAEGIAARPSDIDIVYLNGYGFPAWRGGPMYYADSLGPQQVVQRLTALQSQTGDACWQPAALLQQLADEGRALAELN